MSYQHNAAVPSKASLFPCVMSFLGSPEALEDDTSLVSLLFLLFTIIFAFLISLVPAYISVLQKNRTYNWYLEEIYYKELAHVIMEADKSQYLQGEPAC